MCEGDIQSENTMRDHISQNIGIKKQRKNISHNADDHILLILKIAKDIDCISQKWKSIDIENCRRHRSQIEEVAKC